MAKIVPSAKVGVPIPTTLAADATALVAYYGAKGFTPSYTQTARISTLLTAVAKQTVDGVQYWVFDGASLPALTEGDYDLYFTLADDVGNEGDFSPAVTIPLDRDPPAKLGTPVVLS